MVKYIYIYVRISYIDVVVRFIVGENLHQAGTKILSRMLLCRMVLCR